jgi:hypothetical protein
MNRPALRLVTATAPAMPRPRNAPTPESVAAHLKRARSSGRALSLDLAAAARRVAVDALGVASLGDAVAPGIREDASRTAAALAAFAARVERLAR